MPLKKCHGAYKGALKTKNSGTILFYIFFNEGKGFDFRYCLYSCTLPNFQWQTLAINTIEFSVTQR